MVWKVPISSFSKFFLLLCFSNISFCADFKDFDDSIQYNLNWPGPTDFDGLDPREISEFLMITTKAKEKYNCSLPIRKKMKKEKQEDYDGPNALELLQPLFQTTYCFFRIETYWTYEMCHGRYIRQYHEEKEGKKMKLQEYYLGRWDKLMTNQLIQELDKQKQEGIGPPVKKIDGISVPYLELNFTDGTVCDLNGEPRQTSVQYMCMNNTRSDVLSVKEVATCVYQINIFTQLLCKHPHYRPEETGHHDVHCYPLGDTPKKPISLLQMEANSLKKRHFKHPSDKNDKVYAVYTIDQQDGRMKVKLEIHSTDPANAESEILKKVDEKMKDREGEKSGSTEGSFIDDSGADKPIDPDGAGPSGELNPPPHQPPLAPTINTQPADLPIPFAIQEFISGKHCLRGGSSWWKYKLCYGKTVEQYHIERRGEGSVEMTSILLGAFDKEAHLEWINKNPQKRPKPIETRTYFSQFYTNGDLCEKTGQPRETEVRLKCVDKKGTVSLYLLEPQICKYFLGVESPLICDILDKVDQNGLIDKSLIAAAYSEPILSDP